MVCGTRVRTERVREDSQVFREEVYLSDLRQGLGLRERSSGEVPREPRPGRVGRSVVFCGPVNQCVVTFVFKDLDGFVLMPRCFVWFFYVVLRAVVEDEVESEREILVTVLIQVIRNVLFVDSVLVSVKPVTPDYVIDELFFECSSELVGKRLLLCDPGITILLDRLNQRPRSGPGHTLRVECIRHQVRSRPNPAAP